MASGRKIHKTTPKKIFTMSNVNCQMSNVTVKCKMSQWQCHNVKKEMFYNIENQKAKKKI